MQVSQRVEALNPNLKFVASLERPAARLALKIEAGEDVHEQLAQGLARSMDTGLVAWEQFYEEGQQLTAIVRFQQM